MRSTFVAATLLALVTARSGAGELRRLSLDDVSAVTPRIEVDTQVKVEGQSALRITTRWPTTVSLGEVAGLEIENASLVYSARVKTELDGTAFLEMRAHVDGGRYFSRGMNDVASQSTDWRTLRTLFRLEKGQRPEKVTLNLVINGTGTVWIDDVVLSKEPLD